MKTILRSFALSVFIIFVTGAGALAEPIGAPIRIGVILPLTGDFSFFGEEAREGLLLAQDELKSAGQLVELIFEDDRCGAKDAVTAFSKLTQIDKVDFIIGPGCTSGIMAVAPLAERSEVTVLAVLDAGEQVAKASKNIFALGFSSEREGELLAEHMIQQKLSKVGVLFEEDEWATLVKNSFTARFKALGGTVTATVSQNTSDKDYRTNFVKLLGGKPDALYLVPAFNGGVMLKQLRQLNREIPVFGPDTFGANDIPIVAGPAAEGVVYGNAVVNEESSVAKNLRKNLEGRFHHQRDSLFYTALGYDGLRIAARVQPLKAAERAAALHELNYSDGIISVKGFASNRMSRIEPVLLKILNGKTVRYYERKKD